MTEPLILRNESKSTDYFLSLSLSSSLSDKVFFTLTLSQYTEKALILFSSFSRFQSFVTVIFVFVFAKTTAHERIDRRGKTVCFQNIVKEDVKGVKIAQYTRNFRIVLVILSFPPEKSCSTPKKKTTLPSS